MQRLPAAIMVLSAVSCLAACSGELDPLATARPRADAGVDGRDDDPGGAKSDEPGARAELCNGLDDDSDGEVDEGCGCLAGQTQDCMPAPALPGGSGDPDHAPRLPGICQMGRQECQAEAGSELGGYWGPCVGAILQQAEICGDGIDQDCDGEDLRCDCTPSCAGKICGDDGCAGYCGSPPHACKTTTQQKKVLLRQFFECLGCCERDGFFAGQGLPPCSVGSDIENHYYGGKKPGKPPTKPPYCTLYELISDFPPCAGVAGAEATISHVALHIGSCEDKDPGVHELTYERTCTQ